MVIDVDKIGIKWVPIDRGLTPKEYEKYAKDIAGIVKENSLRGAKSITKNKQGFPSVRIHLEPEFVYINGLRVFLAHATKDRSWADEVFVILEKMGFKVTYLPVDEKSKGSSSTENSQPGVVRLIEESVENSDYLCMLFSKNSASREWVRYEFQLAARLIGRIVMLKDSSVETIADFEIPRFERMAQLTVKTQILDYRGDDPDIGKKIARVIINDPDEGDTDGSYRPLVIWERNLKIEI